MNVTKQQVNNELSHYIEVESVDQVDNKQLFVVKVADSEIELLVSYYTVIGLRDMYGWYYTERKYSVTTAKQLSKFKQINVGTIIPHKDLIDLLVEVLGLTHSQAEYLTDR
jgi:hypothetical protein